ncbi:MAG: response regulator transcription factor [Pseudomonadota bacterium]
MTVSTVHPRHTLGAMNAHHILVIDDDRQLSAMLAELLKLEDYSVTCAESGETGLRQLVVDEPDLVLLDVTLPGLGGFEVLERIRDTSSVPVIMLTARGEPDDRINGLAKGADDYLPKPFNARELLLRISAVLKRAAPTTDAGQTVYRQLAIDQAAGIALLDDEPIALTETEFRVLDQLVRVAPDVASRERLSQAALGRRYQPTDRSLDTHISNLRQKLQECGTSLQIHSVRGSGYRLRDTPVDQ